MAGSGGGGLLGIAVLRCLLLPQAAGGERACKVPLHHEVLQMGRRSIENGRRDSTNTHTLYLNSRREAAGE